MSLDQPIWVRAYIGETDLGRVHPGKKVEIFTDTRRADLVFLEREVLIETKHLGHVSDKLAKLGRVSHGTEAFYGKFATGELH